MNRHHAGSLLRMVRLVVRERRAAGGRDRVPEPMVMDDLDGVRAFHESAPDVQLPVYELNASQMSLLLPRGGHVLDLGAGSGRLAAHLATGRPDVRVTCVDLSEPMLDTGRRMAAEHALDRLTFVRGDITDLDDAVVASPDLVCCSWTLHQLPDRATLLGALREIARIREQHGCAVWVFDFARLRRDDTMGLMFDRLYPDADPRLRVDAVASEAAAWTVEEMGDAMVETGLDGLTCSSDRALGLYQAWWCRGRDAGPGLPWTRSGLPPDATFWADRITAGMTDMPAG